MVLNKKHFKSLAGDPEMWDAEFDNMRTSLPVLQEDQFIRGRRVAKLVKMATGWGVRVEMFHLFRQLEVEQDTLEWVAKNLRKQDAVNEGVTWAKDDPVNREFVASRVDVRDIVEIRDLKRGRR